MLRLVWAGSSEPAGCLAAAGPEIEAVPLRKLESNPAIFSNRQRVQCFFLRRCPWNALTNELDVELGSLLRSSPDDGRSWKSNSIGPVLRGDIWKLGISVWSYRADQQP